MVRAGDMRRCGRAGLVMAFAVASCWGQGCDLVESEAQWSAAQDALRAGRYAAAATRLEASYSACTDHRRILLELAQVYRRGRSFDKAIEAGKRFLSLEPGSIEGRVGLAESYFMAQKIDDARREVEAVLKTNPAERQGLKLKGNIEYLTGHTADAIAAFVNLLDHYPDDEDAPYMLGRIYYQDKLFEYAIGQFKRVLRVNPRAYRAYDNLGLCYQSSGDNELAKRYFLTAIKFVEQEHADYDWPFANLASVLLDEGDAEKAFAFASQAVKRNSNSARNFYLGGKALNKLGKGELALNWLERSVSLDPSYPEPLYLLSRLYSQNGDEAKAKDALEKFRALKAAQPRDKK